MREIVILRLQSNYRFLPALFGLLALGSMTSSAQGEEPEPLKWKPQFGFSDYLQTVVTKQFSGFPELPQLNYEGVVGIAPIPPAKSPVANQKELEGGKTIGALFLSTGSERLHLPPGFFRVLVLKKGDQWIVQFFDSRNSLIGEASASVTEAPKVEIPFVSVDHSVCVRFDETLVCY